MSPIFFCLTFEYRELKNKLEESGHYKVTSENEKQELCYLFMRYQGEFYGNDPPIYDAVTKKMKPVYQVG